MSLENLRDALSDVDRQIIDLIAERQRIVTEIGQSKLAEGTATGLYEVMSNQHEVVMVWATSVEAQVRFRQARDTTRGLCDEGVADDRILRWERRSAEFVTGGDTHLMTPLPRTVYGPDDWEDASLEDWLES